MKILKLTDAQADALFASIENMVAHSPDGVVAVIQGDVMRTLYLQLATQKRAATRRKNIEHFERGHATR